MGHVRETIHIDAPPDTVWAIGADATRFPEWQTNVIEAKGASEKMDHLGARYTSVGRIAGRRLEGSFEVTKVDKPKMIELKGSTAGGQGSATIHLDRTSTGTEYTMELDYQLPGGILGGVVDRAFAERTIERDLQHSLQNLKALCEAEAKVPA